NLGRPENGRPYEVLFFVLLPCHCDLCFRLLFIFGFLGHLAGYVGDDLIDSSGELKRRLVQARDGRSWIPPAVQASRDTNAQRHRDWDVGLAYQFLVDVKLGTAWRTLTLGDVWLACRLELEGER